MNPSLKLAAAVFAALSIALISLRWSVARACLLASNRAFGSRFELDGRHASNGRAVVLAAAAVLLAASLAILFGVA